jgi:HEAT repeat protein
MAREYIARDPRTGRQIRSGGRGKTAKDRIRGLPPSPGPWQSLQFSDIVPLARGRVSKVEVPTNEGKWTLGRIDAIKALHKVLEKDVEEAHEALIEALDDDYPDVRIAGLKSLPSFALRRQGTLFQCLSDRLLDEQEEVRDEARTCLKRIASIFPSGCEGILRRELRDERKEHRDNAFESLLLASREWPEVGCLHLDELIREEDEDLRIRGSKILRAITTKGGAEAWDLIGWSLQDEEVRVRRNAARTLTALADVEPRIATVLVEANIEERDRSIRDSVIRALKKLDMQSPKVARMVIRGARDDDVEMRRACIGQLVIILTGQELREAASDLLRTEGDPGLRKRLAALSADLDFEGTEEEKNKALAPLDKVVVLLPELEEDLARNAESGPDDLREDDKRDSGRPPSEVTR